MSEPANKLPFTPLSLAGKVKWCALAVASFHLAYEFAIGAPLIVVFLFSVFRLAHVATRSQATTTGCAVGMLVYGPQLAFFWPIFGSATIALWFVLAFWLALYVALQRFALVKAGAIWGALAAPLLWTGLEYFRSELYYFRFSWLNAGYLSPDLSGLVGMYGVGFVGMACVVAVVLRRAITIKMIGIFLMVALAVVLLMFLFLPLDKRSQTKLAVAGVQLEFESDRTVLDALDKLRIQNADTQLFVLSEYTFDGPVTERVKAWCATHQLYLIAGGKDYVDAAGIAFRNTAFVIGPDGHEVFKQVKAQPIQFFNDGLPATEQMVWDSPWGKLGLCICYDLSYTRITDELIRQGAQAIIAPTMDVQEWGGRQHRLHARVAPVRAAEYRVPIFRLCSSGISQAVDRHGGVIASAPFPGQGEMMAATLRLPTGGGRLPLDRILVWPCVGFTAFLLGWHLLDAWRNRRSIKIQNQESPTLDPQSDLGHSQ